MPKTLPAIQAPFVTGEPVRRLLCLLLLLIASTVFAQSDEDEQAVPETTLPDITVDAARMNESTDDPPAFVEVIEMEQYRGRMVGVPEVLQQAAGVSVQSFGGLGATATISVRGSAAQQVVVLVDGVRMNPAAGGGADLNMLSADQIERIEIIRSGDSAVFGEGAIGGVVNIVTRKPSGQSTSSMALTYGSFNTWRLAASNSGGAEHWRYLTSGSYLHSDNDFRFRNDNGTTLDDGDDFTDVRRNAELDARSLLTRVEFLPTEQVDLALQNDLYSADAGVPGIVTFPSLHTHQKLLRDIAVLSAAFTGVGVPELSLRSRAGNRFEWSRYRDGYGEQTGVPIVGDRREVEPEVEQSVQYIWGANQILTLTGNYRKTMLYDDDFDNPTRDSAAGALRDQVMLWGGRITLLGAVRYDSVSDAGEQWSPKGGLAFAPWNWLTLKGNVGRSFRAPSFGELYFNQGFVEGNPSLEPETATNIDGGLQLRFPWVFFEGAYFRNEVRDLIEYTLVSGFRYKPFNIGRARVEGMELSGRLDPFRWLSAASAYTLTYAIDTTEQANREDNQIPGRPRHVAFCRLEGHTGIFHPFAEYHYTGGNYITAANTKLLDERRIVNIGLLIAPREGTRLSIEMKNALDEQAVDVRGFPLPGRAMYLTVEQAF